MQSTDAEPVTSIPRETLRDRLLESLCSDPDASRYCCSSSTKRWLTCSAWVLIDTNSATRVRRSAAVPSVSQGRIPLLSLSTDPGVGVDPTDTDHVDWRTCGLAVMAEKHFLRLSARGYCCAKPEKNFPLAWEDEVTRFSKRRVLVKGVALCLAMHVANFRFDHV
ncbi:hypothetical protein ACLKA6_007312, partial [Drosophila palustris]